ncbi:MAG: hypothetical protein WA839_02135 [Flavobacteriaceae bacterium]|tara:strand:+ start:23249 stop:24382 length:1134 start_codon:yes stop_codon:yes gene_type:complete
MKTLHFKITLLLYFSSIAIIAQTENLFSKNFETNDNTTVFITLSGEYVEIESSPDDKFYVDYNINFENYPDRKKQNIRDYVKIKAEINDNHITLESGSKSNRYRLDYIFGSLYKKDTLNKVSSSQKTKATILNEIKELTIRKPFYINYLEQKYRNDIKKRDELIEKYNRKKKRAFNKQIIIKVPVNLNLTIDAKYATILIKNDLKNKLSFRLDGGRFISKVLNNKANIIKAEDVVFAVESLNGGEISLKNINKGLIGSISNTIFSAEFSSIQIGELKENNVFDDFSNETVIHNFSNDFKSFDLNSEYSKIHFFRPKNDFTLKAIGYNTIVNLPNKDIKGTTKQENKKEEFFKLNTKDKGIFSGYINFDIIHGFIFIY